MNTINKQPEDSVSLFQSEKSKTIRHENGILHFILFLLLLINTLAGFGIFGFGILYGILYSAKPVSHLIILALTCIVLIRQRNSDLIAIYRTITWVTLSYLCLLIIWTFFFGFIMEIKRTITGIHPGDLNIDIVVSRIFNYTSLLFGLIGVVIFAVFLFKEYKLKDNGRPKLL